MIGSPSGEFGGPVERGGPVDPADPGGVGGPGGPWEPGGPADRGGGGSGGGGGPWRAQAWATARPSASVKVTHHRVRSFAASQAAISRQVSASAGPCPATSP